jgi:hypothetical protein
MEQPLPAKRQPRAVAIDCCSALLRFPRRRHPWIDALSVVARRLALARFSAHLRHGPRTWVAAPRRARPEAATILSNSAWLT